MNTKKAESLMVQRLRIHLPGQGTWVWSVEDSASAERLSPRGATAAAWAPGARAPRREEPPRWEAAAATGEAPPLTTAGESPAATKARHNQKTEKKAESTLRRVWFSRSGGGPEILHF